MTQRLSKSNAFITGLALLGLVFSMASHADEKTLSVTGSGSASAVPDQVSLTFWIEERGDQLTSQKHTVDETTKRLVNDLRDKGVDDKNIRSYQLHIRPRYEQNDDGKREQNGFVVQREIAVTLTNPDSYDNIIDQALARGVTRVGRVQFEISDQQKLYEQALVSAYQQAKAKAQRLASTAGLVISGTISIAEQSASQPVMMRMADSAGHSESVSLPGEQSIDARLSVTFSTEPANSTEK